MSTALDIRVNSSPICNGWNCRALIRSNFDSKNVNVVVSNTDLRETSVSSVEILVERAINFVVAKLGAKQLTDFSVETIRSTYPDFNTFRF